MIQHYIKCEMCDNKHEIAFLYKSSVWRELPSEWLTLFSTGTDATANDGWHFCTEKCLLQWLTGNLAKEEIHKPSCKTRRFLYIDNETGSEHEGVLFSSGYVLIDFGHNTVPSRYSSWSGLIKNMADADRIQWIDQEQDKEN